MPCQLQKRGRVAPFSQPWYNAPIFSEGGVDRMSSDRGRIWMPLDNAALIFPAIRRKNWNNVFRESVTLIEDVDPVLLQRAVDDLMPRFPSFYLRLRRGVFWYYLEEVAAPPQIQEDYAYPLTFVTGREMSRCCLRVLHYKNRIAVEYFHVLSDGGGAMVYLKTLVARYLALRYGADIPPTDGVLDLHDAPDPEELEDSFQRCAADHPAFCPEAEAYRLPGKRELGRFMRLITGEVPAKDLHALAREYGCTVTVLLAAIMAECVLSIQAEQVPPQRQKPVKITIPVDLRRLFPSRTLRNFALTVNPGVDPRLGTYTLRELCDAFTHQLAAEITPQRMAGRIAQNVAPQKSKLLKAVPIFLKTPVMRAVYNRRGERLGCLNISNLGVQKLPAAMVPYMARMEFIIGVQYSYPNNCSVVTCGGTTIVNMIRSTKSPELERRFFSRLVELGVPVTIETN